MLWPLTWQQATESIRLLLAICGASRCNTHASESIVSTAKHTSLRLGASWWSEVVKIDETSIKIWSSGCVTSHHWWYLRLFSRLLALLKETWCGEILIRFRSSEPAIHLGSLPWHLSTAENKWVKLAWLLLRSLLLRVLHLSILIDVNSYIHASKHVSLLRWHPHSLHLGHIAAHWSLRLLLRHPSKAT